MLSKRVLVLFFLCFVLPCILLLLIGMLPEQEGDSPRSTGRVAATMER